MATIDETTLTAAERFEIVHRKATCPFLGPAVATHALPVRGEASNPLAAIEDVRALGNRGGGDLGELLVLFAAGNHAFARGASGRLDARVPVDLFSLELPGSQGSHAGHSGILQGDPRQLGSGRFSAPDFERLVGRAQNGLVKRSDVARFIAENIAYDPASRVGGTTLAELAFHDVVDSVVAAGRSILQRLFGQPEDANDALRDLRTELTRLAGADDLIGSAGEFGLLFAFFTHKPGAQPVDGEPTLSVEDLRAMFEHKRFPDGWETWKKTRTDWVKHTVALVKGAHLARARHATA